MCCHRPARHRRSTASGTPPPSRSPGGRLLAGSVVGVLRAVDPGTGRVLRRLTGAPDLTSNNSLALSATHGSVSAAGSRGLVRWDLTAGGPAWSGELGESRCRGVTVSSSAVLCGGRFGTVESLALTSGDATGVHYDMQHGEVSSLLVTSDQSTLVELSGTQPVVARWRLDGTGPVTRLLGAEGTPLGYDAGGGLLMVRGADHFVTNGGLTYDRPPVTVVDVRTAAVVDRLGLDRVTPVWTQQPGRLVAWTEAGLAYRYDVRRPDGWTWSTPDSAGRRSAPPCRVTGAGCWPGPRRRGSPRSGGPGTCGPAGSSALTGSSTGAPGPSARTAGSCSGSARARPDVTTSTPAGSWAAGGSWRPRSRPAAWSPGPSADGRLGFYWPRNLHVAGRSVPGTPGVVQQFAFSRDGRLLAARTGDGSVRVVDLPGRIQLGEPIHLDGSDVSIALSPDGLRMAQPSTATASSSGTFARAVGSRPPADWQAASSRVTSGAPTCPPSAATGACARGQRGPTWRRPAPEPRARRRRRRRRGA